MRKYIVQFMLVLTLLFISGCSSNDNAESSEKEPEVATSNPIVTITMEDLSTIEIELYPEIAPNTVANFISLINDNFYDGLTFHRIIKDFMIQGGDPLGTGIGGADYHIKGEFNANKFVNSLSHEKGVISMARSSEFNSASSQFFIMVADNDSLDGQYASFGKVIKGLEVVEAISLVETDANDKPIKPQVIKDMSVNLNGYKLVEVQKLD
ncbi:MAG: peptidylprolyl isomerase [Bacilli bacterium]